MITLYVEGKLVMIYSVVKVKMTSMYQIARWYYPYNYITQFQNRRGRHRIQTNWTPTHNVCFLFSNVLQDVRPTHKFRAVTSNYFSHSSDTSQFRFSNTQEDKVLERKTEIFPVSTPFSFKYSLCRHHFHFNTPYVDTILI